MCKHLHFVNPEFFGNFNVNYQSVVSFCFFPHLNCRHIFSFSYTWMKSFVILSGINFLRDLTGNLLYQWRTVEIRTPHLSVTFLLSTENQISTFVLILGNHSGFAVFHLLPFLFLQFYLNMPNIFTYNLYSSSIIWSRNHLF